VTLEEMIEWSEITSAVWQAVNALEECSTCRRITECESLSYIEGYYCKRCIRDLTLIDQVKRAA
jgi:hypothetical protein